MSKTATLRKLPEASITEQLKQRQKLRAHLWYLLIEPLKPKTGKEVELADGSFGELIIPEQGRAVEEINITIGQVLQVGPLCYQNNTKGGLDMRRFSHEIEKPNDLIGRYVVYKRYTGLNVYLRTSDGERAKYLLLDDDAVICDVDDPNDFVFYYD